MATNRCQFVIWTEHTHTWRYQVYILGYRIRYIECMLFASKTKAHVISFVKQHNFFVVASLIYHFAIFFLYSILVHSVIPKQLRFRFRLKIVYMLIWCELSWGSLIFESFLWFLSLMKWKQLQRIHSIHARSMNMKFVSAVFFSSYEIEHIKIDS